MTDEDKSSLEPCITCGRAGMHWSDKEARTQLSDGTKASQRGDKEDRTADYREWRRTIGRVFYVSDIDQVEWVWKDGDPVPLAILELTRVDGAPDVPDSYLHSIEKRFKRDGQWKMAAELSDRLSCGAYIVAFMWDLSMFWVLNMHEPEWEWWTATRDEYADWLRSLRK